MKINWYQQYIYKLYNKKLFNKNLKKMKKEPFNHNKISIYRQKMNPNHHPIKIKIQKKLKKY